MKTLPEDLRQLLGLSVCEARKGHGSFVTFNLTATPSKPIEEFYVWVYMCDWRLLESRTEIAHSESDDASIEGAVAKLNRRRLEGVSFHTHVSPSGVIRAVTFAFDGDAVMKLQQYAESSAGETLFMIRSSTGAWASYDVDGTFKLKEE